MIIQFQDHRNRHFKLSDDLAKTDSPYQSPPHLMATFEEISLLLRRKHKSTEKKLLQLIEENPGVPQLKNYLTAYYSLHGQNDKAFAYNRQIVKEHPDYLFAKVNLALEYITLKEPEKVCEVLGRNLDLQELYPGRKVFHVTEYINFYKIVFRYWHFMKQIDQCREILSDLRKLEKKFDGDFGLEEFERLLLTSVFEKMLEGMSRQKEFAGIARTAPTLPQTEEAPSFYFPQIQWLYENSFSIEKRKVDELLGLERGRLTEDLSAVVYDAIRRYVFFSEKEYQPETHDFIVHAMLLLQQLEAHEGLPALLDLLRQPKELLDYWLSDLITEYLWQVIYATGKNQLHLLEEFLKEPLNDTFVRSAVSTAISQIVLRHPERREEVVALYKRLLDFYYQNRGNPEIYDGTFTAFIIGDIVDFNGRELTQEMKRFYDEAVIDEFVEGKWNDVQHRLETDDANRKYSRKRKLQHIYELIKEMHDFEQRDANEETKTLVDQEETDYLKYEDVNSEGGTVVYSGYQPYHREEKKVGRNDPCPCGSGLKYKKCHGKNT